MFILIVTMHKKHIYLPIFVFVCAISAAKAAKETKQILLGLCYNETASKSIDLAKFSQGIWYELYRYDNEFEGDSDCNQQSFIWDENKSQLSIIFSFRSKDGTQLLLEADVNYTNTDSAITGDVIYPHDSASSSFMVLGTDDENYSVIYSCWQISTITPPEKQERLWVLSRTVDSSDDMFDAINSTLQIGDADLSRYLYTVSHLDCS